jgi:hypothetical protein
MRWYEPLIRLAVMAILLVLFALALVLLPLILVVVAYIALSEKRFRYRLLKRCRLQTWLNVKDKLRKSQGSLILEVTSGGGQIQRFWFVEERLSKLYPDAPWGRCVSENGLLRSDLNTLQVPSVCAAWCREHLRRQAGRAVLIELPQQWLQEFLYREQLPSRVVVIVAYPNLTRLVKRAF